MLRKLLIAAAMLGAASPAYARNWWVINHNTAQCATADQLGAEAGVSPPVTPESFTQAMRASGDTIFPKTIKDDAGNLLAVELEDVNGQGRGTGYIDFYTSETYCENSLANQKSDGSVVDPKDMN